MCNAPVWRLQCSVSPVARTVSICCSSSLHDAGSSFNRFDDSVVVSQFKAIETDTRALNSRVVVWRDADCRCTVGLKWDADSTLQQCVDATLIDAFYCAEPQSFVPDQSQPHCSDAQRCSIQIKVSLTSQSSTADCELNQFNSNRFNSILISPSRCIFSSPLALQCFDEPSKQRKINSGL